MFPLQRILLPTDLSDLSLAAFPYAVALAERFNAEIAVLYADPFADPIDLVGGGFAVADPERIETMRQLAKQTLETHAREHIPDKVKRELIVDVDAPYRAIVRHAESADLIVMSTHGRSGWKRAILGSVTETVLRETSTPILTIRQEESQSATPPVIDTIVCPVNFTEMASLALMHAGALAQAFDSEIVVVHVAESDAESGEHSDQLESWIPGSVADRVKNRKLVLKGDPAEEVVDLAKKEHADLIVVGAQHKRFSDTTVVGVTTERITRHAPCAVLTVHSAE